MSLRVRRLRLVAETPDGPHGTDLEFEDGLVVLRADNTSGKSTCVQAIVYGLGLEPMLTMRHEVPLPHAMTDRLECDGRELPVLESHVMVEVQNGVGETLTVQRWAKSESYDRHLIRTWNGPALTDPSGAWQQRDTFVRLAGSATREAGFHRYLEQFLGWSLPRVARTDGAEVPLYLEQVFPLFFVEQKRGWSGIQAQMPAYAGIPEARSRAPQFVLALDVYERARRRRQLRQELDVLAAEWLARVNTFNDRIRGSGTSVQGLPDTPQITWPPEVPATLLVAASDANWVPVSAELRELRKRLRAMEADEIPTAEQAARQTSERLQQAERDLAAIGETLAAVNVAAAADERQLDALDRRLAALEEDIRETQDAQRLSTLGAEAAAPAEDEECPTCHQQLPATLLTLADRTTVMSLEENLIFLHEQRHTFEGMKRAIEAGFKGRLERAAALRRRIDDLRRVVRADRQALIARAGSPR